MRSYGRIRQMPLFATCTIANAISALCAPPGVRTVAPWFRAIRLRVDTLANSRLACRLPGVGNAASPSAGAILGVLRARAGLPRCSGALRRVWSRIWRVRATACAAAQLRPHSASATAAVRRRIRRADGFKQAMAPAWHGGRAPLKVRRSVCCSCNRVPDGLHHHRP